MTDVADPASPGLDDGPDDSLALSGGDAAPEQDRIAGIIAQTRSDYRGTDLAEIEARLRQRFDQSEIDVDESELADYARQIADAAG